ncbi:transposase [Spiroplasma endosymbiont of Zeiraphera isertana]|uniref:transposase n=1 Tax=Spiroplasma endosymbiont of Zeiraphera isertana TaxID=3066313 RepID=UPI00313EC86B
MANINSYNDEFKKQIVDLYQSGKSVSCLAKEYNVTRAATYNWIKQFTNSGSFKSKDNRSVEENELIKAFLPLCTIFKFYHINAEKSLSTDFSPHF